MTERAIGFELTNRCNLACPYCLRDDQGPRKNLSLGLLQKILDQAPGLGIRRVAFTGGEPLLHPQFEPIIRATAAGGFRFSFASNGHLLPEVLPWLAEPAVREQLVEVAISLDGADAATHDAMRGEGSFRRVMKAVAGCHGRQIPVKLLTTVTRRNRGQLDAIALLAAELEAKSLDFSHLHPTPDNLALALAPAEWRQVEAEVARLADTLTVRIGLCAGIWDPSPLSLCACLNLRDLYVDAGGRLFLCCILPTVRGTDLGRPEADLVADLNSVDLVEAQARLVDLIAAYHRDRLGRIARDEVGGLEHFQCLACARYFGKLQWLARHPESPWAALAAPGKEQP